MDIDAVTNDGCDLDADQLDAYDDHEDLDEDDQTQAGGGGTAAAAAVATEEE